jgi:hypothetical protein
MVSEVVLSRVKGLPEGKCDKAAKKTKPMSRVVDVAEGSAAKVFVGLAFISLSSNVAGREERLPQRRKAARKKKHKEEASGMRCSAFVSTAAFAK